MTKKPNNVYKPTGERLESGLCGGLFAQGVREEIAELKKQLAEKKDG